MNIDRIIYYALNIFLKSSQILFELLPYVVLGSMIGEALKFKNVHRIISKLDFKNKFLSEFCVIILGMISPLCTYGTVPIVLRLSNMGISIRLLIIFLITSSMINPQLFIMTLGGISLDFALNRVVFIILFGLVLGLILRFIPEKWILRKELLNKKDLEKDLEKDKSFCSNSNTFIWKDYFKRVLKSLEFVGFYIVIGVVLASTIEVLIPNSLIKLLFKPDSTISMIIAALISVPLYYCGGGTIPLINSLLASGMSKGAALAFFNVGSATRINIIMALAIFVRPIFIVVYIFLLIIFSLIMGVFV